jgi:hypothetical protein
MHTAFALLLALYRRGHSVLLAVGQYLAWQRTIA